MPCDESCLSSYVKLIALARMFALLSIVAHATKFWKISQIKSKKYPVQQPFVLHGWWVDGQAPAIS